MKAELGQKLLKKAVTNAAVKFGLARKMD